MNCLTMFLSAINTFRSIRDEFVWRPLKTSFMLSPLPRLQEQRTNSCVRFFSRINVSWLFLVSARFTSLNWEWLSEFKRVKPDCSPAKIHWTKEEEEKACRNPFSIGLPRYGSWRSSCFLLCSFWHYGSHVGEETPKQWTCLGRKVLFEIETLLTQIFRIVLSAQIRLVNFFLEYCVLTGLGGIVKCWCLSGNCMRLLLVRIMIWICFQSWRMVNCCQACYVLS